MRFIDSSSLPSAAPLLSFASASQPTPSAGTGNGADTSLPRPTTSAPLREVEKPADTPPMERPRFVFHLRATATTTPTVDQAVTHPGVKRDYARISQPPPVADGHGDARVELEAEPDREVDSPAPALGDVVLAAATQPGILPPLGPQSPVSEPATVRPSATIANAHTSSLPSASGASSANAPQPHPTLPSPTADAESSAASHQRPAEASSKGPRSLRATLAALRNDIPLGDITLDGITLSPHAVNSFCNIWGQTFSKCKEVDDEMFIYKWAISAFGYQQRVYSFALVPD